MIIAKRKTVNLSMGTKVMFFERLKKLNNRSPYETFSFYHGEAVLQKPGCKPAAAGDIMLKPALLKK